MSRRILFDAFDAGEVAGDTLLDVVSAISASTSSGQIIVVLADQSHVVTGASPTDSIVAVVVDSVSSALGSLTGPELVVILTDVSASVSVSTSSGQIVAILADTSVVAAASASSGQTIPIVGDSSVQGSAVTQDPTIVVIFSDVSSDVTVASGAGSVVSILSDPAVVGVVGQSPGSIVAIISDVADQITPQGFSGALVLGILDVVHAISAVTSPGSITVVLVDQTSVMTAFGSGGGHIGEPTDTGDSLATQPSSKVVGRNLCRTIRIKEVNLETIDQAVYDWFDKTVDVHVANPNGERAKVAVRLSSGERAVTSRQKKGLRDRNGVLILPLISVRRTGIDPAPSMQALGTEVPALVVAKCISPKTNDLRNLDVNRPPPLRNTPTAAVYEVTTIPFPDRNILTYELVIQTQYIVQMNKIIEKIFHQLDLQKSFVAPFENTGRPPKTSQPFEQREAQMSDYVVGFFENNVADGSNFEEFTDQERIIRYTTTFRVPATLQLDPEGVKPVVRVEYTSFKMNFGEEHFTFVDDPNDLDKLFRNGR